jgi:SAM-dependent methyltransferase
MFSRKNRSCRLCKSSEVVEIFTLKDMPSQAQYFPTSTKMALSLKSHLDLVQCSHCGLVQILGKPVTYYKEIIRSNHVSGSMRSFRVNQLKDFLKKYKLESGLLLEVGCSNGDILEILQELELNFHGMEYRKDYIKNLTDRGFRVFHAYPSDLETSKHAYRYDAFLSFNVLEHATDLKQFLSGIRSLLNPNAVGLIEVPNFNMILSQDMISEFMLEHLTYFTKKTLRHALESTGFEVLEISEVWHEYLLSAVVINKQIIELKPALNKWSDLKLEFHEFLKHYSKEQICVWGAGHQSLATLALLDLNELVEFVVDNSPNKQNKLTPSTAIPIVSPQKLKDDSKIRCVIVLGGSYSNEIIENLRANFPRFFRILSIDNAQLVVNQ